MAKPDLSIYIIFVLKHCAIAVVPDLQGEPGPQAAEGGLGRKQGDCEDLGSAGTLTPTPWPFPPEFATRSAVTLMLRNSATCAQFGRYHTRLSKDCRVEGTESEGQMHIGWGEV